MNDKQINELYDLGRISRKLRSSPGRKETMRPRAGDSGSAPKLTTEAAAILAPHVDEEPLRSVIHRSVASPVVTARK